MTAVANDFDFVVDAIEKNYAGFPSKVIDLRVSEYVSLKASLRDAYLSTEDPKECEDLLRAFLAFFNDKHISIQANGRTAGEGGAFKQKPFFERIDGDTALICIPSFLPENYEAINNLIQEHHEVLTNTTNLVIDLRGNGGGSDDCFNALLPYVCPESIEVVGADVRATQGNIEYLNDLIKVHEFPEEALLQIKSLTALMSESLGSFVEMVPTQTVELANVFTRPKKVAICVDKGCASSTEQFLIFAVQNPKTILFGETTAGCIDFSNVVSAPTPSNNWILSYPISRSKRIPFNQIDGHGIEPHFRMDTESKELINDVVKQLHSNVGSS
jgi:C-terminal processing protease CtpA/Prc